MYRWTGKKGGTDSNEKGAAGRWFRETGGGRLKVFYDEGDLTLCKETFYPTNSLCPCVNTAGCSW